jgi:hypothetical protein
MSVTLEVHLAQNYMLDTTAHLLYVEDPAAGGREVRYHTIAQGSAAQQACHPGNAWLVRGSPSNEVLCEFVATADPLQLIVVGGNAPAGSSKGVRAVWDLGTTPREELVFATRVLLKVRLRPPRLDPSLEDAC